MNSIKKQRRKLRGVYSLLFAITFTLIISCTPEENINLRDKFIRAVWESGEGGEISTFSDTSLIWHKLYLLPPEYSDEDISRIVGFEWDGPTVPNMSRRFLFVDSISKSIDYFDLPSHVKIWMVCLLKKYYTRSEAVFISERSPDGYTEVDYWVRPIECRDLDEGSYVDYW